ncbi:DUF748 domain-containing protein [Carboxylicivirga sp. A043]|uniref:DUF748 domain-containing protein n=1 Tax=Carboxylicivirga litoralis TaxID=2816963 RepID=UPI0021CB0EF4|nr:DUF748 domain-containing protein [Carboxylicivirga sp. A043]MCU4156517.1 DUF748 domain-containing protein [Carboxylicivirga sp. A043]
MKHIKKRYYVLMALALIIFLLLFFLSTFIRNYVNNNSKELVGRKIELSNLSINYFRVAVRASDLMVYETNETDTFAGFREFYINFDPTKLLGNEYSFSTISLDSLFVNVIQDENGFNFDDLIPPADSSSVEETDTTSSSPFRFAIHNIQLLHGHVSFYDKTVDNKLRLDDVSLNLPLIAWNSESSDVGIEFEFGEQGKVFVGAHVDQLKKDYNVDFRVEKLELKDISSYVEDAIDAGGIEGFLNTNLNIKGSIERTNEIFVNGESSIESFRLWDLDGNDVFSVNELKVGLKSIDVANENYRISEVLIDKPVITASLYKDMSNIERMLLPLETTDSTQIEPKEAVTDSTVSKMQFRVDKLAISKGEIIFTDHTLYRPFHYDFKEITVDVSDVTQDAETVPVHFSINMNDQGTVSGKSTINMLNPEIFDMEAQVKHLRLMSFSPYTEYHIARPITQGDFNYDLSIKMTPTHMMNNNDIVINELEIGSKTKHEPQVKAPVKLGLYLMKDPKDVITIHMPVEGNPSDPNFSVRKLVWKAFSNLLVKVAASPFNALGNLVGTRPEELESIPMPYAQDSLETAQREILDKIAHITEKKPQLIFSFEQQTDPDEEKSAIGVNAAKKQYLAEKMPTGSPEEIALFNDALNSLDINDEEFVSYVNSKVAEAPDMAIEQKCRQLIGENQLDDEFRKLLMNRNELIAYYLLQEKGVDSTSIEVNTADLRNLPEELRKCHYKVEVSVK